MGAKKEIKINNGRGNAKQTYYYWEEHNSYEEAVFYAKKIKEEKKGEVKLKYYILETKESWFLPVAKFIIYLNKDLSKV